jgi:hypothetical protein
MGTEMAAQSDFHESDSNSFNPHFGERYFASKDFRSLLKNLTKSHEKYIHMKTSLYGLKGSGFGLDLCQADLAQKIETLVSTVDPKSSRVTKRDGDDKTAVSSADDIGEKRKRLKEQFFGGGSVESHRDRLLADRLRDSDSSVDEKVEEGEDWMPKGLDLPSMRKGKRGRGRKGNIGLTASPTKEMKSPRGRGRGRGSRGRGSRGGSRGAIRGRKARKTVIKPDNDTDSD